MSSKVIRIESYDEEEFRDIEGIRYQPLRKDFKIKVPSYEERCGNRMALNRKHGFIAVISRSRTILAIKTERLYEIIDKAPDDVDRHDLDDARDTCHTLQYVDNPTYIDFIDDRLIVCSDQRITIFDVRVSRNEKGTSNIEFVQYFTVRTNRPVKRIEYDRIHRQCLVSFLYPGCEVESGLVKLYNHTLKEQSAYPGFTCGSYSPDFDKYVLAINSTTSSTPHSVLTTVKDKRTERMIMLQNVFSVQNVIWFQNDKILVDGMASCRLDDEDDEDITPEFRITVYDLKKNIARSYDYAWPTEDPSRFSIFQTSKIQRWNFHIFSSFKSEDPFFHYHKDDGEEILGNVDDSYSISLPRTKEGWDKTHCLDGFVIDYSYQRGEDEEDEIFPPLPVLIGLTSEGVLFCYKLTHKMMNEKNQKWSQTRRKVKVMEPGEPGDVDTSKNMITWKMFDSKWDEWKLKEKGGEMKRDVVVVAKGERKRSDSVSSAEF